jgi:ABC-type antimicrobial peptide transport system, permease component
LILTHDLLQICARQVFRQRRRNLGVLLAVALGTASLIAILTLGDEVKRNVNRDLNLLGGATLIKVSFTNSQDPSLPPMFFPPQAVDKIRALPNVDSASLGTEKIDYVPLFWRMKQLGIPVSGVDDQFWRVASLTAVQGVLFGAQDMAAQSRVCVIGEDLASTLFGEESPIGQYLPIYADVYKIVGVVGGMQIGDRKKAAFVPLTTIANRSKGDMRGDRLIVRCDALDNVGLVSASLPILLSNFCDARYLKLEISWLQLERVSSIIWWVQLFVGISITATLTLGGFGILNGMMSSVAARTREIGLKKAMGAEERDIMFQFLLESIILSLSAAVIGTIIGCIAVQVGALYLAVRPSLLLMLVYCGISLVFSVGLGVAAGYYPALRAARMDAVMAIRYE